MNTESAPSGASAAAVMGNGGQPAVPKGLITKLTEVMALVERVPKRGHNDYHGYDYATEADIVKTVRTALAERHVLLIPGIQDVRRELVGEKGSALTTLAMTFTFLDGDTGEELTRPWAGAGTDKEDKGLYKAITGGEKYFLLKSFLMETGDDPEHPSGDRQNGSQERPQARGRGPRVSSKPGVPAEQIGQPDRLVGDAAESEREAAVIFDGTNEGFPAPHVIAARMRAGERECAYCKKETVYASKKDGGWFCWKKKGGCGAQFVDVPAPASPTATPVIADEDRTFMLGAVRRKVEEYKFDAAERQRLKDNFLAGKMTEDAATGDLHELYLFLNDAQAVSDWRSQRGAA